MDILSFWKQKIIQAFHDPPAKPYAMYPGTGGHKKVAGKLFELFCKKKYIFYRRFPDWAASGADRPVIDPIKGVSRISVWWPSVPYLTHPLCNGPVLDVRVEGEDTPSARAKTKDLLLDEEEKTAATLGDVLSDWQNYVDLKTSFFLVWRRFREELAASKSSIEEGDLLWEAMPAETRCPDISIWDHLRVTTALAFMDKKELPEYQKPWFFKFSIGPVQSFIRESRTSRDLWISSFILSDLAWHAMEPVVEHYGPDVIIYPELRGNPLVDNRLSGSIRDFLPENYQNPRTFAAMLPDSFTAIVPRGRSGNDHLVPIEELAEKAEKNVKKRWKELADIVKEWLIEILKPLPEKAGGLDSLLKVWNRQHEHAVYTYWTAVAWEKAEPVKNPLNFRARALPFQKKDFRIPVSDEDKNIREEDRKAIADRQARLAPFMPLETWACYEWFREVYGMTNLKYLQNERGFDYAVTHHQLNVKHCLRNAVTPFSLTTLEEYGEKCTVCGKRQALTIDETSSKRRIDGSRKSARDFWSNENFDPEKKGSDRLCGICAMKRFLVKAGNNREKKQILGINPLWAGLGTNYKDVVDSDGEIRVPFPSTSTIAAQRYLVKIAADPDIEPEMKAVNKAFKKTGWKRTTFPRVLPRFSDAARSVSDNVRKFLEIDAQDSIFPDALEGKRKGLINGNKDESETLEDLIQAVKNLQKAARKKNHGDPGAHIAVIRMDGDHMGRLLLGDKNKIGARMKDILHPDVVGKIEAHKELITAGWPDLLEAKRLMGPSLHAFISRALAGFSHNMVPWVVEREFAGRLIYAGGDDVLCIAPAADALFLASRLQQLFSAPWVIDTNYRLDPWSWRTDAWNEREPLNEKNDRLRFAVLDPEKINGHFQKNKPVRFPVSPEFLEPHPCDSALTSEGKKPVAGRVFPMLGEHSSLSAGIVFAHFKTSMSLLLEQSQHLLNDLAKEKSGRSSIALSHFSRNGMKTEFFMRWKQRGFTPNAHTILGNVLDGFSKGSLPSRLPYKLREISKAAAVGLKQIREKETADDSKKEENFLKGLFTQQLQKDPKKKAEKNALELWKIGMKQNMNTPERSADGLLLLRAISGFSGGISCTE